MIEALVDQTGSILIELKDRHDQLTDIWDRAAGVNWTVPPEIEMDDDDPSPLDANLTFVAPTEDGAPVRIRVTLDADPSENVAALAFESDEIAIALPSPGQAVSGSVLITLHQVA